MNVLFEEKRERLRELEVGNGGLEEELRGRREEEGRKMGELESVKEMYEELRRRRAVEKEMRM